MKKVKANQQYDIKRLGRIVTLTNKMLEIVYHMDEKEYKRFRDYLYSRTGISFPFSCPFQNQLINQKSTSNPNGNTSI